MLHAEPRGVQRGGGHRGFGPTVGQAVEDCIKAAESDATKRAFVTFGNIFGLALYDKEQKGVGTPERRQIEQSRERPMAPIDEGFCRAAEARLWQASRAATEWTNATLQPPPPHALEVFAAAAESREAADELCDNFGCPEQNWEIFGSPAGAATFLARHGRSLTPR